MIALSTSCLDPNDGDADSRIAELLSYDVEGYEFSYRITAGEIEPMGRAIRAAGRSVASLHSFCPVPSGTSPRGSAGDLLLLTSEDTTLRNRGVAATIETLEWAARLEARFVVCHSGRTPIEYPKHRIRELYDGGKWPIGEGETVIRKIARERAETAERCLDLLRLSLDRILVAATRLEVSLGLENRVYPHEIPNPAEFGRLIQTFEGAPLGTWYDTGHARYQEVLGFAAPQETWDAMRSTLLGCHVHDVIGIQDHLPPGEGELNLSARLRDLPEELPLVIECRPGQGHERIAAGIDHLRTLRFGDENAPADPFLLG